ncbi:MAG: hypothetical protein HKN32_06365, partial [Flavobacteriales bacterium]|nr:hypothetical protein [Flavobacteriales bacterium]
FSYRRQMLGLRGNYLINMETWRLRLSTGLAAGAAFSIVDKFQRFEAVVEVDKEGQQLGPPNYNFASNVEFEAQKSLVAFAEVPLELGIKMLRRCELSYRMSFGGGVDLAKSSPIRPFYHFGARLSFTMFIAKFEPFRIKPGS